MPPVFLLLATMLGTPTASAQAYSEDFDSTAGPNRCEWDRVIRDTPIIVDGEVTSDPQKWGNRACNRTANVNFPEYGGDYRCPGVPAVEGASGPQWITTPPLATNHSYCAGAPDPLDETNCVLQVAWEPYCFAAGGYRSEISETYAEPLDEDLFIYDLGSERREPPWRGLRGSDDTWLTYRFYVHSSTVDMMDNLPLRVDPLDPVYPALGNQTGPTWIVLHQFHYILGEAFSEECEFPEEEELGKGPLAALLWSQHSQVNGGEPQVRVQSRDRTDQDRSGKLLDVTGFAAERWHTLVMHIKWSGAAADDPDTGLIETWINGEKLRLPSGPDTSGQFRLPTQQSKCRHTLRMGQYVLGLKNREVEDIGEFRSDISFDDIKIGHSAQEIDFRRQPEQAVPLRGGSR